MEQKEEIRRRHFSYAVDYIYSQGIVKKQYELAKLINVSTDTIANILKHKHVITELTIAKLQKGVGHIFNTQFLRGESDIMLQKDVPVVAGIDSSTEEVINAKNEIIDNLKAQLEQKSKDMDKLAADKDKHIDDLAKNVEDLRQQVSYLTSRLRMNGIDYTFPTGAAEGNKSSVRPQK